MAVPGPALEKVSRSALDDPSLYHVVLDATAIPSETCVDLLALAAGSRGGTPVRTPSRSRERDTASGHRAR